MLSRIKRIVNGLLGKAIVSIEDPETILRNNISDMRQSLAKLNYAVVLAKAGVLKAESRSKDLKSQESYLLDNIKTLASNRSDETLGVDLSMELIRVRNNIESNEISLSDAKVSLDKIKRTRDSVEYAVNQEINNIDIKMAQAESAKIKGEIATCLSEFSDSDLAFSNKEMLAKLETQKFIDDSKFETSVEENTDIRLFNANQEVVRQNAVELFESFKGLKNIKISSKK